MAASKDPLRVLPLPLFERRRSRIWASPLKDTGNLAEKEAELKTATSRLQRESQGKKHLEDELSETMQASVVAEVSRNRWRLAFMVFAAAACIVFTLLYTQIADLRSKLENRDRGPTPVISAPAPSIETTILAPLPENRNELEKGLATYDKLLAGLYDGAIPPGEALKRIDNNYVQLRTANSLCSGLVISTLGHFITADHCVDGFAPTAEFHSKSYKTIVLARHPGYDVAFGVFTRPLSTKFDVLVRFLADPTAITIGTPVDMIGWHYRLYHQTGVVDSTSYTGRVAVPFSGPVIVYDRIRLNSASGAGYSGGPAYIGEDGGQVGAIVGVVSSSARVTGRPVVYTGIARVDHIADIMKYLRDQIIVKLKLQSLEQRPEPN